MTFTSEIIDHQTEDFQGETFISRHWYSGIYKITYYQHITKLNGRPGYVAYYKPKGWKNWGDYVNKYDPYSLTLEEAQQACKDHAAKVNP